MTTCATQIQNSKQHRMSIEKPRFELMEVIGRGQFGNVWKARWLNAPLEPEPQPLPALQGQRPISLDQHQIDQLMQHNFHDRRHQRQASFHQSGLTGGPPAQPATLQEHHVNASNLPASTYPGPRTPSKFVAVKRIKIYEIPNSKERNDCLKEVKLLQELKHPNIIDYKISFIEQNELFIVLELADGGDLSKLIKYFQKRNQLLNEKTILKYFTQVCSAIEYIHSKRILHRDIKPANVFMTSDGIVKLGDFGLGRFFSQNTREALTLLGTFYYMSPERICESGYSFSSDVWSLGCVLYELITLYSPFNIVNSQPNIHQQQQAQQQNPHNLQWLFDRIIKAEYPSLSGYNGISHELRQLVVACLSPNPDSRPTMSYICRIVNQIYFSLQMAPNSQPVQMAAHGTRRRPN